MRPKNTTLYWIICLVGCIQGLVLDNNSVLTKQRMIDLGAGFKCFLRLAVGDKASIRNI